MINSHYKFHLFYFIHKHLRHRHFCVSKKLLYLIKRKTLIFRRPFFQINVISLISSKCDPNAKIKIVTNATQTLKNPFVDLDFFLPEQKVSGFHAALSVHVLTFCNTILGSWYIAIVVISFSTRLFFVHQLCFVCNHLLLKKRKEIQYIDSISRRHGVAHLIEITVMFLPVKNMLQR